MNNTYRTISTKPETHRKAKMASAEYGIDIKDIMEEAITLWIRKKKEQKKAERQ